MTLLHRGEWPRRRLLSRGNGRDGGFSTEGITATVASPQREWLRGVRLRRGAVRNGYARDKKEIVMMAIGDVLVAGAASAATGGVSFKTPYKPGPYMMICHFEPRSSSSAAEVKVAEIAMKISGYVNVTWNIYKTYYTDTSTVYAHLYKNAAKVASLSVGALSYLTELSTTTLVNVAAGDTLSIRQQASATMTCYNDMFLVTADGVPDQAEMAKYGTILM